ncbi:hypothetical protein [Ruminococcus bromii]|uniref:hypothetical protein n=1 Tax=Ruminococcus bromii TaxID=40518 RepID=UPI0026EA9182|nr:hypothetical protein [Ruminococcus bromii]
MTENNDNRNTITYDDDWKSVSYSEYPKTTEDFDSSEEEEKSLSPEKNIAKKDSPKQLVITIQLVCCILIALAAFLLNLFGGEVYAATREWYYSNLEKSVVFDTGDNKIDLSNLFTATSDEVSSAEH